LRLFRIGLRGSLEQPVPRRAVASGSTVLGLACALIVARTTFPFKGSLRALTILPIITPPFVIGLAMILLFGRAGPHRRVLADWFGIARSRWIYGWPGVCSRTSRFTPIAFLVLVGVVEASARHWRSSADIAGAQLDDFSTVSLPLMRARHRPCLLAGLYREASRFRQPSRPRRHLRGAVDEIFYAVVGSAHDRGGRPCLRSFSSASRQRYLCSTPLARRAPLRR